MMRSPPRSQSKLKGVTPSSAPTRRNVNPSKKPRVGSADALSAAGRTPVESGCRRLLTGCARGDLRELTEYLARTCFPEIAVPQATAELVASETTSGWGVRQRGADGNLLAAGERGQPRPTSPLSSA